MDMYNAVKQAVADRDTNLMANVLDQLNERGYDVDIVADSAILLELDVLDTEWLEDAIEDWKCDCLRH